MSKQGYNWHKDFDEQYPEAVPVVVMSPLDHVAWEDFFHSMPQQYLEILVCMYLGLTPEETVKVLRYPNIYKYVNTKYAMRVFFAKQRSKFFEQ